MLLFKFILKKFHFQPPKVKTADNDSTPLVYLLKKSSEKGQQEASYKLKVTYQLSEVKSLRRIDERLKQQLSSGATVETEAFAFEMEFENEADELVKFVWQCETCEARDQFLDELWKLSEQFVKTQERPKFFNYEFRGGLDQASVSGGQGEEHEEAEEGNGSLNQAQQSFEISKKDEEALITLMTEFDFVSSNADQFIQRLESELVELDTANIESIMNSEENTLRLIDMLDQAAVEIESIDARLKAYEDKISAVGDAVRTVGERDNVIQMQQNNQHALLDILEGLVSALEFADEHKSALKDVNLGSAVGVHKCVSAANQLLDVLEAEIPAALRAMNAYEEQRKELETLKVRFANNAYAHLKNSINHAVSIVNLFPVFCYIRSFFFKFLM